MIAPRNHPPLLALVDELLAEQGRLQTPAARASHVFDQIVNRKSEIANFQSLIPLTAPGPGEQYAFEVDLDSCSGCKACVVACHSLNGLDKTESWRDVGLVHGGSCAAPYQQTITTACHHCADPACLNGCPVLAYEKDPVTGIVRHLDDQCIGCQYCVLKCPYDVPKYSERLGIVRKCDMCHQRLGAGEAPACVQACPTQAIRIVMVTIHGGGVPSPRNDPPRADTSHFLPAAPDPAYTQPTTRYVSRQPLPANARAADASALRPHPPHWPLVIMLTLLSVSVGCFTVAALTAFNPIPFVTYYVTNIGWAAGTLGLAASVFHLGQRLRAWRIFLGWRKSWLSREAVVFGAWFGLATATIMVTRGFSPHALPLPPLLAATALTGLAGLFCSVMIYVDTRREFWRFTQTAPRFLGTALVCGLAFVAPAPAALALTAKLAFDARSLRGPAVPARLLRGPLPRA
ncbi:MAG: dimethyl sulfoxide reductase anchor subunit, partial [Opitutae bacterium]|nr:dimethyl sulfoxide reductase anchor subunit [Opitutae bacterium]